MIETLFIMVILCALIMSTITDFKHHEVPDWLSFGLIFAGIGLRFIASASSSDWLILGSGFLGLALCFLLSLAMFYTGQWGGGDSKLLMGMGAMIGLDFNGFPQLILFLINTLILGGFYGIAYSIYLGIKHKEKFMKELKSIFSQPQVKIIRSISFLFLFISVISLFIIKDLALDILLTSLAIISVMTIHAWAFMRSVERVSMFKQKSVNDLVEGDWVVKNIFSKGKKIVGPKDLGITKKQIMLLKKYKIRKVLVKEGIPFVPSFLLGYIATLILGNWMGFFGLR